MSEKHPHLKGWMMLPAPKDTCAECAVAHDPTQPHNQQSLDYQYDFYGKNGRWPTWIDAMAHCSEETKTAWISELKKHGVNI